MSDLIGVVATLLHLPGLSTPAKLTARPVIQTASSHGDNGNRPPASNILFKQTQVPPPVDPDRPTGPPPAFDANLLEADSERKSKQSQPFHGDGDSTVPTDREAVKPNSNPISHDERVRAATGTQPYEQPSIDILR
ncbi:MAG: hypothetical protein OEY05_06975 [Paracoccaceae bacterium]|nr:hypothetical protein [Paracoccaceae bacterium]